MFYRRIGYSKIISIIFRPHKFLALICGFIFLSNQIVSAADCPPSPQLPTPALIEKLKREARDRGFLWRISKDNHVSWLYGTLHVGKLEWTVPGPTIVKALRSSALVAVELDASDPDTLTKLGELSHQGAGQIPEVLRARIKRQLDAVCLPETAMDKLNLPILFSTIEVLAARRAGLETTYGAEMILLGYARASKKTIVPLETAEGQMTAVGIGDSMTNKDIEDSLQLLESGRSQQIVDRLSQAWAEGNIDDLEKYASWCGCMDTPERRDEMKRVLDDRNGPLADAIDALHSNGKSVFAAVGALHMVGAMGLPALLERRGYTISSIAFDE